MVEINIGILYVHNWLGREWGTGRTPPPGGFFKRGEGELKPRGTQFWGASVLRGLKMNIHIYIETQNEFKYAHTHMHVTYMQISQTGEK